MTEIKAKNRTRFFSLIAVILVLSICLSVFASFELNAQAPILPQKIDSLTETTPETATSTPTLTPSLIPIPIPVTFTCNSRSKYAFTVIANVDLNDEMNQAEATTVAEAIINHELKSAVHGFKSANVTDAGIWTINFSWGATSPDGYQESLSHYFDVTINPSDRTVTYSRCY